MATFGSTINPALGRTDYSAYTQGAMQGAQGVANAGQIMGQAISQIGQTVGQAIEQHYQKKREKELEEKSISFLGNFAKENPDIAGSMGIKPDAAGNIDPKLLKDINKSLGGPANTIQMMSMVSKHVAEQKQQAGLGAVLNAMQNGGDVGAVAKQYNIDANQLNAAANWVQANTAKPGKAEVFIPEAEVLRLSKIGQKVVGRPVQGGIMATAQSSVQEVPKYVLSPEEQAKAESARVVAKSEAESAVKTVSGLLDQAPSIGEEQWKIGEMKRLLDSGAATSGAGQEFLTNARSYLKRAGFSDDGLKDQQQFQALIGEDAARQTIKFLNGQGSVSNEERKQISQTAAQAGKDPEANKKILVMREAAANRTAAAIEYASRLQEDGNDPIEISKKLNRWWRENSFSAFYQKAGANDFSNKNSAPADRSGVIRDPAARKTAKEIADEIFNK
jgi:hypothetical protein